MREQVKEKYGLSDEQLDQVLDLVLRSFLEMPDEVDNVEYVCGQSQDLIVGDKLFELVYGEM